MKLSKKNFFSAMRDAWKRSTVAMLCMVVIGLLVAFSCDKPRNGTKNLQYVRTELGGCNRREFQDEYQNNLTRNGSEIEKDTVIITISEDSVHVFIGIPFTCKVNPFETRVETIDDIVYMFLIDTCYDSGNCYMRCPCYYTFDFAFKYQGKINQKYKILLFNNKGYGDDIPIIISEGIINKKNR